MRILLLALSSVMLSGCSWLGLGGSGGLFGGNSSCYGQATQCAPATTGSYTRSPAQSAYEYSDVRSQYSSPASCETASKPAYYQAPVQNSGCAPASSYSVSDTSYYSGNTQPAYSDSGLSSYQSASAAYGGNTGYSGESYGYSPAYGVGALGAAPALRGQYGPSNRQSRIYGNAGLNWYDVDSDSLGAQLRGGYQATRHLGAEVEGSIGLNSGVDYSVAGFLVGRVPVVNRLDLIGRVGYHYTDLDFGFDEDDIAYGVGAEYALSQRDGIRVDYTVYEDAAEDSVAVSYTRKF